MRQADLEALSLARSRPNSAPGPVVPIGRPGDFVEAAAAADCY